MSTLGTLGVLLAVAALIFGALRGVPLFPLCTIAIIMVALSNRMNMWTAFSDYFLSGAFSAIQSFLLILSTATIYSELMDKSGSTKTIVRCCLNIFGKNNAVIVILIMALILSTAGMNGMMIAFALYSITCVLLKESNLPRHLSVALILFAGNFGDGFYPLSCHINNVLPGQFLGTKLTAAAGFGLCMGAICLAFASLYLFLEVKRIKRAGEVWTYPVNSDLTIYEYNINEGGLPSPAKAFAPMFLLTGMVIFLSNLGLSSGLVACSSMLSAAAITLILNVNVFKVKEVKILTLIHECLERTVTTLAPFIFLLGVGQVISETEGYKSIVNWIIGVDMSPYWKAAFSTATISGVMASGAGGIRLCLTSLGDYFINSGANLETVSRIITMSSTGLDTLPHCGAVFVLFKVFDLTHKEAYRHCFWLTVVNTCVCTVIAILTATALGI